MNARVEAVHADLAWELMPGGQAEHALVVTAAGVPGRRRIAALPPEACDHVGFLVLDWALGEDDVTRWIGEFRTTAKRPAAGVLADGLIEAVRTLARRAGTPRWTQMQRRRDGAIVLASVARPAQWVDHPLLDLHVTVALPFAERTPAGLPGPDSLGRLRDFEEVRHFTAGWPGATVNASPDPGWRAIRHLTG